MFLSNRKVQHKIVFGISILTYWFCLKNGKFRRNGKFSCLNKSLKLDSNVPEIWK